MPRCARRWLQSTKNRASATSASVTLSKWMTSHSLRCTVWITDPILPPPRGQWAVRSEWSTIVEEHLAARHLALRCERCLARRAVREHVPDDKPREVVLDDERPATFGTGPYTGSA